MCTVKKIIILSVLGTAHFIVGMEQKRFKPSYIKPAAIISTAGSQAVALSVVKPKVTSMPLPVYHSVALSTAYKSTYSASNSVCEKAKTFATKQAPSVVVFSSSFSNKTVEAQHESMKELCSAIARSTQDLSSLNQQLKTLQAKSTCDYFAMANTQKQIDNEKSFLEQCHAEFREGIRIFSSNLRQKLSTCNDIQSKVTYVLEVVALHDQLEQKGAPRELLDSCACVLSKCLPDIVRNLSVKLNNQPLWLQDGTLRKWFGLKEQDNLWVQLQNARAEVHAVLKSLDPTWGSLKQTYKPALVALYKARTLFKNFDRHVGEVCSPGLDFAKADKQEYRTLINDLREYRNLIDTCITNFERRNVAYSAQRFIKILSTPQCLSQLTIKLWFGSAPRHLWNSYEKEVRDFVLENYKPATLPSRADPVTIFAANSTGAQTQSSVSYYELLMRKLVIVCQLKQQIQAMDEPSGVDEYNAICQELNDMGGCLASMIAHCRDELSHNSQASLKDLQTIASDMAHESWLAYREKQANKDVITKVLEFYWQALWAKYANICFDTNFHDAPKLNLGPIEFKLTQENTSDIVGEVVEQYKKIDEQLASQQKSSVGTTQLQQSAESPQAASIATNSAIVSELAVQQERQQNIVENQKIIRYLAFKQAQAKAKLPQETDGLGPLYELLEPSIILADNVKLDFSTQLSVDMVQTVAGAGSVAIAYEKAGDKKAAGDWQRAADLIKQIDAQFHTTDNGSQGVPFKITHEALIKAQAEHIEAMFLAGDGDCCVALFDKRAEITKALGGDIAHAVVNAANPVNMAKGVYHVIRLTGQAYIFAEVQKYRLILHVALAPFSPELSQKFLNDFHADNSLLADAVSKTIQGAKGHWNSLTPIEQARLVFRTGIELGLSIPFQEAAFGILGEGIGAAKGLVADFKAVQEAKVAMAATPAGLAMPARVLEEGDAVAGELAQQVPTLMKMDGEAAKLGANTVIEPAVINKQWTKLGIEELKKLGAKSLQNDIREVQGTAADAWEFFKAQVKTFDERDPGVYVGMDDNGITFVYRATSKSVFPTIDIKGIKSLRKIKFKTELGSL